MKRTAVLLFASLSLFVFVETSAQAQAKDKKVVAAKPDASSPAQPRVKNYDFDADLIDGELVKPEGEFLNARKFAEHGSLIRVRTDFIREIVKSAEDL
jgi:hypothetical protein